MYFPFLLFSSFVPFAFSSSLYCILSPLYAFPSVSHIPFFSIFSLLLYPTFLSSLPCLSLAPVPFSFITFLSPLPSLSLIPSCCSYLHFHLFLTFASFLLSLSHFFSVFPQLFLMPHLRFLSLFLFVFLLFLRGLLIFVVFPNFLLPCFTSSSLL